MDEAQLREAIAKHAIWLETRGRDGVRADLSQARLSGANLSRVNLSFANLSEADLSRADLYQACLGRADLSGTNLSLANLSRADLSRANLHLANLSRAHLGEANLTEANLLLASLSEASLRGAHLNRAHLSRADLRAADLSRAHLGEADLHLANLSEANLRGAHLSRTDLSEANLSEAELSGAELRGARLHGANLQRARLCETNLSGADLSGARVYGTSTWNVVSDGETKWRDLVITPSREPPVTADDIEVAQFVYLLFSNDKTGRVIEAVASRMVLIIGRFGAEQAPVLEALKEALRQHMPALVPVVFDIPPPSQVSVVETVLRLTQMARFVIADLTDAKRVLPELRRLTRDVGSPIVPIVREGPAGLPLALADLDGLRTALPVFFYRDAEHLIEALDEAVIKPAEAVSGDHAAAGRQAD
jgi:uncharacterized protein YjbI with pentapeptide repeats